MQLPAPENWGRDEITKFLDNARANELATYANLPQEVERLVGIDQAYRKCVEALNNSKDWFAGFFILQTHSNFLGACRLTWSGQVSESYALLRLALENALYGLYLAKNPMSRETWLRRQDDATSKKKVKDEFKIGTLLRLAVATDPAEGTIAKTLYERTIDHGAHPNELALMQALNMKKESTAVKFSVNYLQGNALPLQLALKTSAQVGVCCLSLFRRVIPERFAILGIEHDLVQLKRGL